MNQLQWKLRRLLAMSPSEVALRAGRALRERLQPLPNETPEQTWRRHYAHTDPLDALQRLRRQLALHPHALSDTEKARLIAEADALQQGHWHLFGYPVQLDDPPCWRRNYCTGKDWLDAPAKAIDYRRIDIAGGAKYVWEPSRGQPILRLAQAHALTGDSRYAETCLRWLTDWIERNPRGWGVHWTSALEHAIRVFAWSHAIALLGDALCEPPLVARLLGALIQHAEFIERHLSPGSSANNHLIGEAAALAFLGALLPDSPLAARWRRTGYAILEREAVRQFYADGVNAEQAFGYLPFVWEFYLHAYRQRIMPSEVALRLSRSLEFVRNVMDASGYVPQVGDEDDGTVVPLWSAAANRYCVVGRALATLIFPDPPPPRPDADAPLRLLGESPPTIRMRPDPLPAISDADDALSQMLFGKTPPTGARLTQTRIYPDGGYAVLHAERWQVLFDAGPLGLGSLAAHGHADALSVCASLDGKPLLIDTGTYAYHEDPDWRNHFRSTPAHNTLALDGRNQSEILGAFLWGRKAHSELASGNPSENTAVGITYAYAPSKMARRVRTQDAQLAITDLIEPDGARTAQWYWHFHPDWQVAPAGESAWRITDGQRACLLRLQGLPDYEARLYRGDEATKLGWYSPRFGHKVPCTTLRITASLPTAPDANLKVAWSFEAQ
ncbi:MAG: heparinase II/III family protein [Fimbriimonadales bacterium]|nr:heparinase II/III family protein [Fimbriimonadales bacterium]